MPPGYPRSGVDWQPITPDALYYGPRFFHERYGLPLWITENGLPTRDQLFLDGCVHDPQRIDYMHRNLLELRRAMREGARVDGYFAWSLLDNFEWRTVINNVSAWCMSTINRSAACPKTRSTGTNR